MNKIPYNPKAKWKKLFSREYSVQYTEISLGSVSDEVKGLSPYTFYEQAYIPEENNEVAYVDEAKWDIFLAKIQKKWVTNNVGGFYRLFLKTGNEYLNYAKKSAKLNFEKKANNNLMRIYQNYQKLCTRYSLFIWAAYYLNDFCAERARALIQEKLGNEDSHIYFDAVFSPLKRAAILELANAVGSKEKLSEKESRKLFEKYKWIPCLDIQNPAWTYEEFKSQISNFTKKKEGNRITYKQALKDLSITKKEKQILDTAKLFAYIKDLRDDFRRQAIFYTRGSLFKEIAARIGISVEDLAYMQEKEIVECLSGGIKCQKYAINERKKGFVIMYNSKKEKVCISGIEITPALQELGLIQKTDLIDLHGMPASKGTAKGIVSIVKGIKDLQKVRKGDILVAVTTHPDYVPAMQNAVAIVTDEGGVTSHAAIVAREIGIPCVVGTKTATKNLKDGDFIEVNANTGVIKVLKKNA